MSKQTLFPFGWENDLETWKKELEAADKLIFNILSDPELVYLPPNLRDGDVWQGKGW